jgi:hypothetical protein
MLGTLRCGARVKAPAAEKRLPQNTQNLTLLFSDFSKTHDSSFEESDLRPRTIKIAVRLSGFEMSVASVKIQKFADVLTAETDLLCPRCKSKPKWAMGLRLLRLQAFPMISVNVVLQALWVSVFSWTVRTFVFHFLAFNLYQTMETFSSIGEH